MELAVKINCATISLHDKKRARWLWTEPKMLSSMSMLCDMSSTSVSFGSSKEFCLLVTDSIGFFACYLLAVGHKSTDFSSRYSPNYNSLLYTWVKKLSKLWLKNFFLWFVLEKKIRIRTCIYPYWCVIQNRKKKSWVNYYYITKSTQFLK